MNTVLKLYDMLNEQLFLSTHNNKTENNLWILIVEFLYPDDKAEVDISEGTDGPRNYVYC